MDWEMPLGTWGVGKEEQCPLLAPLRSPATPVTGTEEEDTKFEAAGSILMTPIALGINANVLRSWVRLLPSALVSSLTSSLAVHPQSLSHVRCSVVPGTEPARLLCPWDFQARILE